MRASHIKPKGGFYEDVRDAVKEWNGEELEEAGENAGIPMPLARNIKDVLKMDAFTKSVGLMPIVSVEKVGESDPIPFTPNPKTPLDGMVVPLKRLASNGIKLTFKK